MRCCSSFRELSDGVSESFDFAIAAPPGTEKRNATMWKRHLQEIAARAEAADVDCALFATTDEQVTTTAIPRSLD